MKWLIFGSGGQLATALEEVLTESHQSVYSFTKAQADITSFEMILKITEEINPDFVVNAAAFTKVDLAEIEKITNQNVNSYGAINVAKVAKKCKSILFQISTDYVFSGESDIPWQEDSKTDPKTEYGRSKVIAEKEILKLYPDKTYIIRTSWLYSPWGKNFVKTMIWKSLDSEKNIEVVCDQFGQPTNAVELASKILEFANVKPEFGIYHCTNSGQTSWFDFAQAIFEETGKNPEKIVPIKYSTLKLAANRPGYSVLGHTSLKRENIKEMKHWKLALQESIPKILLQMEKESLLK